MALPIFGHVDPVKLHCATCHTSMCIAHDTMQITLWHSPWVSRRRVVKMVVKRYPHSELLAAGWSLGGNILVRYLGEEGDSSRVSAAASLCNPLDLVCPHHNVAAKPTGLMLRVWCAVQDRQYSACRAELLVPMKPWPAVRQCMHSNAQWVHFLACLQLPEVLHGAQTQHQAVDSVLTAWLAGHLRCQLPCRLQQHL